MSQFSVFKMCANPHPLLKCKNLGDHYLFLFSFKMYPGFHVTNFAHNFGCQPFLFCSSWAIIAKQPWTGLYCTLCYFFLRGFLVPFPVLPIQQIATVRLFWHDVCLWNGNSWWCMLIILQDKFSISDLITLIPSYLTVYLIIFFFLTMKYLNILSPANLIYFIFNFACDFYLCKFESLFYWPEQLQAKMSLKLNNTPKQINPSSQNLQFNTSWHFNI